MQLFRNTDSATASADQRAAHWQARAANAERALRRLLAEREREQDDRRIAARIARDEAERDARTALTDHLLRYLRGE